MQGRATDTTSLRGNLQALRRRKWFVMIGVVLGVAVALVYSLSRPTRYSATAEVLLQSTSPADAIISGSSSQYIYPSNVATEVQLVTSSAVKSAVAAALHVGVAPPVSASENGTTNIIDITATNAVPATAAADANAYADAYIGVSRAQTLSALGTTESQLQSKIAALQKAIANPATSSAVSAGDSTALTADQSELSQLEVASATNTGGAVPASSAIAPTNPSSPRPTRDAILGLIAGLLLGGALAFLVDYLDNTLKSREDLVQVVPNLPALGIVPYVREWKDRESSPLVSVAEPKSQAAEAYRTLRTSLQFISMEDPISVLLVTSPSEAEGKTSTSVNLAVAMAQAGHKVIVLCCDLRRPRVHEFFGLSNDKGFTSVLIGEATVDEALQQIPGVEDLWLLASGPQPPNPADLLSSPIVEDVVSSLRERADLVLIDCPPVLPVTDASVLSDLVDAILMVVKAGSTTGRDLARAVELLGQVRAPLLGTVLNGVKGEDAYGGQYGYRYGYVYGEGSRGAHIARRSRSRSKAPSGTSTNGNGTNGSKAPSEVPDWAAR